MFKVWSTGLGALPVLPRMFGRDPPELLGAISTGLGAGTSAAAGLLSFTPDAELLTMIGAAAGFAAAADSIAGANVRGEDLGGGAVAWGAELGAHSVMLR